MWCGRTSSEQYYDYVRSHGVVEEERCVLRPLALLKGQAQAQAQAQSTAGWARRGSRAIRFEMMASQEAYEWPRILNCATGISIQSHVYTDELLLPPPSNVERYSIPLLCGFPMEQPSTMVFAWPSKELSTTPVFLRQPGQDPPAKPFAVAIYAARLCKQHTSTTVQRPDGV